MSLQAGLPSAKVFTETILMRLQEHDPGYTCGWHGGDLSVIASDLEKLLGTTSLRSAVVDLMALDSTTSPPEAQLVAADLFDLILTTNYDTLIERADQHRRLAVVDGELDGSLPEPALIKLHGSLDNLDWLVLTQQQLEQHARRRHHLLDVIRGEIRRRPLIAVGSSLRDPSIVALFNECKPEIRGWLVSPLLGSVDALRAADWRLEPVVSTAEDFFSGLVACLETDSAS
ncbi:hypothetical protein MMOR_55790 [Mycolicibacterium moriokaense]|uniref:SIR2-like domain-containing protein n=2 Tax=Mycolicibacterium moriokaense TaxID=39691 RepID=A0AAD1HID8_9MYCO|nr:hypothetical protein MMOR_55790 [Mycolicibacterium moriokaense]